jgi:hypothetical protein
MNELKQILSQIDEIRIEKRITKAMVKRNSGNSNMTAEGIIKGDTNPTLESLIKHCNYIGAKITIDRE